MGSYAADITPTPPAASDYAPFKPAAAGFLREWGDSRGLNTSGMDQRRVDDLAYALALASKNGSVDGQWRFYAKAFPSGATASPDSLLGLYSLGDSKTRSLAGLPEPQRTQASHSAPAASWNADALAKAGFVVAGRDVYFTVDSDKQPTARALAKVLSTAEKLGVHEVQLQRGEAGAVVRNSGGPKAPDWDVSRFPGGGHTVLNIQKACELANCRGVER